MPLLNPQDPPIASYTSPELANGTGWVNFYPCLGNATRVLCPDNAITSGPFHDSVVLGGGEVMFYDHDYDILLNKSILIQGTTVVNIPCLINNNLTIDCNVKLRKWDGASETEIASGATQQVASTGAWYQVLAATITVSTATLIKAGETLRVTFQFTRTGGAGTFIYTHDPSDSNGDNLVAWTTITSRSTVPIPVRIRI